MSTWAHDGPVSPISADLPSSLGPGVDSSMSAVPARSFETKQCTAISLWAYSTTHGVRNDASIGDHVSNGMLLTV